VRACPKCGEEAYEAEVRDYDNRSVEAVIYLVCRKCRHENGPFKL
jgi:predicted nucleic-acid-binding Zn-ribbon protein